MNSILILIIGLPIAIIVGAYLATKKLNKDLNESLKKMGYKILAVFAIFNLFDNSSSEVQSDQESNKKTD
jgi:drug/metabolite transporter superfamily protein YnfA